MSGESPVLLVVDDEPDVADLYAKMVPEDYHTRVAYSGEQALARYDGSVDVVLLDRRMPDLTGDEVLEELRTRPGDCRVAMVTAVDPDFDVLEMGFDDYITKPTTEAELLETVENLLTRATYEDDVRQYFALVTKRAALVSEKTDSELDANEEYQALLAEIERFETELDGVVDDLTIDDYAAAFRDLQRG